MVGSKTKRPCWHPNPPDPSHVQREEDPVEEDKCAPGGKKTKRKKTTYSNRRNLCTFRTALAAPTLDTPGTQTRPALWAAGIRPPGVSRVNGNKDIVFVKGVLPQAMQQGVVLVAALSSLSAWLIAEA